MKVLREDFVLNKYGLSVRFVNESDAEFIVKLRTDDKLSRYIHSTSDNIDKQVHWIKSYKEREKKGIDYYFVFLKDGERLGLNRMYNIHDRIFTTGSWVFSQEAPFESSILASIIVREIAFETLDLLYEDAFDGCHVENKKVLKFNKMIGLKDGEHFIDEKGEYVSQSLTKEDFLKNKHKILKLLGY